MHEKDDTPERIDRLLRQLDQRIANPAQWLENDELEALRAIAEYREEIVAQFKYTRARRLLFKEWRAMIVGLAALLALIISLRDDAREVLQWFWRKE